MEKFGLFDLFAALAGTGKDAAAPDDAAPRDDEPRAALPKEERAQGVFTAEERKRRAQEALLRHEAISRRIGKGKK